jgi:membrane-associated phospholipid phosphatase
MIKYLFVSVLFIPFIALAQISDTLKIADTAKNEMAANHILINAVEYKKPKLFSFATNIPADIAGFAKNSFSRKNLKGLGIVAGSTALLYLADQVITNSVQSVAERNNICAAENFSPILLINIGGKPTNIGKLPKNINTAFYNIGQGSSVMLLAGSFFIAGKIKKNNRALQTASELTEAFLALGIKTQVIKYATGRENPSDASTIRGRWKPFPNWSDFQNNKPRYDAFPSGHLATFISAVTIIGENYPEKKWIKPVGYSIAGLIGLSMINNGVHWASDFPLGFALGYGFGKFISKKHRIQLLH